MSTQTPTPNEDTPRTPSDPAAGRNDPAIDPDGKLPEGSETTSGAGDDKAKDNSFSPDFAPEPDPDKSKPGDAKDADIDTDGG
jgi:hypothetical protein